MVPARQRFEPGEFTGLERDDRLVVKLNLFSFDGAFHVDLQTHLLQRVGMHPGVENLVARAPRLGLVHRHIRLS